MPPDSRRIFRAVDSPRLSADSFFSCLGKRAHFIQQDYKKSLDDACASAQQSQPCETAWLLGLTPATIVRLV